MITRALLLVAAVSSLAHADAAKAAKLLRDGRALEAKDPKAAQAKLTLALAESPADPKIMAELGYAALLAKDYATAETMTRKAIAAAGDDTKLKAAATYNLGDILAAKGDKKGADAAHAESKQLRATAAADAAHGSFEASETSFAATKLDGPFKSVDAFCAKFKLRKDEFRDSARSAGDEVTETCGVDDDDTKATLDGHAVRIVVAGWHTAERIHRTYYLAAIQLADGWYAGEIDEIVSAGGTGEGNMALTLGAIDTIDLAPDVKAIAIHETMSVQDTDEKSYEVETRHDDLAVCALGKSGKPSCIPAFEVAGFREITDHGTPTKTEAWGVNASFPKNGTIVFAADKKKKQTPPDPKLVGAHPLAFP